jgi:hypothetical protein
MAARIAASLATRDPKQAGRARVRGHLPVKKSKRLQEFLRK